MSLASSAGCLVPEDGRVDVRDRGGGEQPLGRLDAHRAALPPDRALVDGVGDLAPDRLDGVRRREQHRHDDLGAGDGVGGRVRDAHAFDRPRAFSRVRFQTTTSCSARARLRAIGAPMIPVPRNAIFMSLGVPRRRLGRSWSSRTSHCFPLAIVALPSEAVPLHIFEPRYRTMIAECLENGSEFGIVWASEDGLRQVGCACEITEVLERHEDGRHGHPHPRHAAVPARRGARRPALPGGDDRMARRQARAARRAAAIEPPTRPTRRSSSRRPTPSPSATALDAMSAYDMAATVDFGLEAKQGLLSLRSENARLRLVTRLLRAALKRLDFIERAQARARSNGKVRFG